MYQSRYILSRSLTLLLRVFPCEIQHFGTQRPVQGTMPLCWAFLGWNTVLSSTKLPFPNNENDTNQLSYDENVTNIHMEAPKTLSTG